MPRTRAAFNAGCRRLRSRVLIEKSRLNGLLRITADPTRVGPLPDGVVVRDSEISGRIRIGSDRPSSRIAKERGHRIPGKSRSTYHKNWDSGERWARNIVLQNNRIEAELMADGASFSLIDNDIGQQRKSIRLTNSGPVHIRSLTADGRAITTRSVGSSSEAA